MIAVTKKTKQQIARQATNREAREKNIAALDQAGVQHRLVSLGNWLYLVEGKWDFWPTTGTFSSRRNGVRGRGVDKLIALIRGP